MPTRGVAAVAGLLVILDQASKAMVRATVIEGTRVPVLGDLLGIVPRTNTRGVSWWVPDLPGWAPVLLVGLLWLVLLGALPVYRFHVLRSGGSAWATVAAAALAGGVGGHLADGLFVSGTTDWIQVAGLPACNLADVSAYVGLTALLVEAGRLERGKRGMGWARRWAHARATRREFVRFVASGFRRRR